MADDPNVGQPFGQQGAGTPGNPAATTPPASINPALTQIADDLANKLITADEAVVRLDTHYANITKRMEDWQTQLKGIISQTEDYEEGFKRLVQLSKSFATSGIFKQQTYRQLKRNLEDLQKTQAHLLEDGFFDPTEQKQLQSLLIGTNRNLVTMTNRMKELGKSMDDNIDPELFEELARNIRLSTKEVRYFADAWSQMHFGEVTKGLLRLNQMMGGNKAGAWAQAANRMVTVSKQLRSMGKGTLQSNFGLLTPEQRARAASAGLWKVMGVEAPGAGGPRVTKYKPAYWKTMAANLSQSAGGGGWLDRMVGARVLKRTAGLGAEATPEKMGVLGRTWMAGGGSFTQGIKTQAMGGLGSMASAASPYLAIGELLMNFVDANAKANREIAENLGGAGIYGGGGSGYRNLMNVRQALTPSNFGINWTGESRRKNLAIASAMAETGVNLPELATGNEPGAASGFGQVKNLAYHGAKLAGFVDEAAATKEIMKLLQQYHTSFEGTKDFFYKLNKDTAAAGITTTKYIGIIDELNNQFDRMGKSLEQTTNIMRNLGRTGVESADDVRDALETITNRGQTRSFEMQAFLNMEAAKGGRLPDQTRAQEGVFGTAAKRAREALSVVGIDLGDIEKAKNPVERAGLIRQQLMLSTAGKPIERQQANAAVEQLEQEAARLEAARKAQGLAAQGRYGEAGMSMAASNAALGYNLAGRTSEQFNAVREALGKANQGKGYTLGQLVSGQVDVNSDPALTFINQLMQNDPQFMMKMRRVLSTQAGTTVRMAGQGQVGSQTMDRLRAIAEQVHPGAAKMSTEDLMKLFQNPQEGAKVAQELAKQDKTLQDIVDTEAGVGDQVELAINKEADDRKAEDIATATRPMAEVFADAFDALFQTISQPLKSIFDWLQATFGGGIGPDEQQLVDSTTEGYKQHFDELYGAMQDDLNALKAHAKDLKEELKSEQDPVARKKKEAELNLLESKMNIESQNAYNLAGSNRLIQSGGFRSKSELEDAIRNMSLAGQSAQLGAKDRIALKQEEMQRENSRQQLEQKEKMDNLAAAMGDKVTQGSLKMPFGGPSSLAPVTNITTTNLTPSVLTLPIGDAKTNMAKGEGTPAQSHVVGHLADSFRK